MIGCRALAGFPAGWLVSLLVGVTEPAGVELGFPEGSGGGSGLGEGSPFELGSPPALGSPPEVGSPPVLALGSPLGCPELCSPVAGGG